ncbi:hypothetical protein [Chromobacterium haemolyticum]|uniref:hypothetical protein n=1 Tax=Chromobacterium haemolyticum TaxID=394935 RepID=UPI001374B577|nr:hypothetical protein [Chromobacterium haemolyticum]
MSLRDEYIKAGIIKPAAEKNKAEFDALVEDLERLFGVTKPLPAATKQPKKETVQPKPQPKVKAKKSKREPTLADKLAARARNPLPPKPLTCPLCGEGIRPGGMLDHKALKHGERAITPSPIRLTHPPERPIFVRGGSPGLKKK